MKENFRVVSEFDRDSIHWINLDHILHIEELYHEELRTKKLVPIWKIHFTNNQTLTIIENPEEFMGKNKS